MDLNNIKNIACLVEYDGSKFFGFQKQNSKSSNISTIQGELEVALSKFTNEKISITSAGRTDTGVHALGQVINFKTTANRTIAGFIRGTNALLPSEIVIHDCIIVNESFNARFDAVSRTYYYYLLNTPTHPAILHNKVGWYYGKLDLLSMQKACSLLLGEHDFSSFRAANCQANNPIKIMLTSEVNQSLTINNLLQFKFTANSFLYHMVRNIIGALVYVGNGKLSVNEFAQLIVKKDRTKAPPTFMADGLYLAKVSYPNTIAVFNHNKTKSSLLYN
ncbi:MAG: tRNA pseudouridine(38-40) synthase TruA [Neisseriaceae bacterium]